MAVEALDGRPVEERRGVLPLQREPSPLLLNVEREVHLGHPGVHLAHQQSHPRGQLARRQRRVAEDEEDLDHGMAGRVASRLQGVHQLLKGEILMRVGPEGRLAQLGDERRAARLPGKPGAEDQGMDEEPGQTFELQPVAVGARRAEEEIVLPGIAAEERAPAGEEDHEERGFLLPGERYELADEIGGQIC